MATSIARISDGILVGHLQTPLEGATVVSPDMPRRTAYKLLSGMNFDQAPVIEHGVPVGYVLTKDLAAGRGSVASRAKDILPRSLASETAPLEDALDWLDNSRFLFMLRGQALVGFVVPSDLNKQAGRAYIYIALAELELRLASAVRTLSFREDILNALPRPRATAIEKKLRTHTVDNVEADVVAEMNLSHLFRIYGSDEQRIAPLCSAGAAEWDAYWKPINDLRNKIAHTTRPLLSDDTDLGLLRRASDSIHRLIEHLVEGMGTR